MTCVEKSCSKVVLADITNMTSSAQPFNSIIDYLLPSRSTIPPPSEPLPSFERPATPLGVRAPDLEDLDPDQDLASACSRIVSESWEGLAEALQSAKDSIRTSASGSPTSQTTTPPILSSVVQNRLKTPRRKSTRKTPKQPSVTPPQAPVKIRYHGHSNSALADYKFFWNSRCEDWMRYEAELEEASLFAYDGIQKLDLNRDRKSAPASCCPRFRRNDKTESEKRAEEEKSTATGYRGKYVPDLAAPIYPRTGDLTLLHHPGVLETELFFVGFPLHKIHQIFFAFSLDQRFERHQDQLRTTNEKEPQQEVIVEDDPNAGSKATEDSSFWSEDTLVEDEELLSYSNDRKPNGRYQEVGLWEADWATKWEVLMNLFKEHELEHRRKIGGTNASESGCFETLEPYRAALADNSVAVCLLEEREDQFTGTGDDF